MESILYNTTAFLCVYRTNNANHRKSHVKGRTDECTFLSGQSIAGFQTSGFGRSVALGWFKASLATRAGSNHYGGTAAPRAERRRVDQHVFGGALTIFGPIYMNGHRVLRDPRPRGCTTPPGADALYSSAAPHGGIG